MLSVAIIDDEPPARRALLRLIVEHGGLTVVGEAGSVREAAKLIEATKPQAAFLDIEMAGQNGFELLRDLSDPPRIVVVTAHSLHAAHSFDVEAVDFLLKPVLPCRFAMAVRRLHASQTTTRHANSARLNLPTHRGLRIVEPRQIAALQAERDYTRIMLVDEPSLLVSRSLGRIAAELTSPEFVRLGRSLVVNMDHVREIRPVSRDRTDLVLAGTMISLGRTNSAALKRWRSIP